MPKSSEDMNRSALSIDSLFLFQKNNNPAPSLARKEFTEDYDILNIKPYL